MVMTMALLENYMKSEVENLHLRIDILSDIVEKIDERLARVERQLALLVNAVEDLSVRVAVLEQNMLTKADLQSMGYVTKADLQDMGYATKADIESILSAFLKQFVQQTSVR